MTKTVRRTDSELKNSVVDELRWIPSVDSTHIGVSVNDGAVTLTGEVDSYPERVLAYKAAGRVHGVIAIAQEITVNSAWSDVTDTDIARDAGEAVQRAIDVPDTVKVTVHDRVITLSGSVMWHFEREAAERAVHYVKGVTAVLNTLKICRSAMAGDIKTAIGAALVRNARLEGKHIAVTTNGDGVVTLEGTVRSWAERRQAEHTSWAGQGVTEVVDHLTIEY